MIPVILAMMVALTPTVDTVARDVDPGFWSDPALHAIEIMPPMDSVGMLTVYGEIGNGDYSMEYDYGTDLLLITEAPLDCKKFHRGQPKMICRLVQEIQRLRVKKHLRNSAK